MNEIETIFYDDIVKVLRNNTSIVVSSSSCVLSITDEESTREWIKGEARVRTEYGYIDFLINFKTQAKIGNYITDFLISFDNPYIEENYVAIEIDGHEWHEKTKEQVARDKQRERCLLRKDYPVMRFSGSEVFHNHEKCAIECFEIMLERTAIKLSQCRRVPEIAYPYIFDKEDDEE